MTLMLEALHLDRGWKAIASQSYSIPASCKRTSFNSILSSIVVHSLKKTKMYLGTQFYEIYLDNLSSIFLNSMKNAGYLHLH